jgi:hypothetical protein
VSTPPCPCDTVPALVRPMVPAGLPWIPRQIAPFPAVRRVLLSGVAQHPSLGAWRTREPDDLGMLLLEWWSYVCDVTSFYDEVITNESFLRTSQRDEATRDLVALLGYRPRPAVGATIDLAVVAEPTATFVDLPVGTAFRTGSLPASPPQVFEADLPSRAHPTWNAWRLRRIRPTTFAAAAGTTLLLDGPRSPFPTGSLVLVMQSGGAAPAFVTQSALFLADDGINYPSVTLDRAPGIAAGTTVSTVHLRRPTLAAGLWKQAKVGSDPDAITTTSGRTTLVLDGLHRSLRTGDHVIVRHGADVRWFTVHTTAEVQRTVLAPLTSQLKNASGTVTGLLVSPAITVSLTTVTLDTDVNSASRKPTGSAPNWGTSDIAHLVVNFGHVRAGRATLPYRTTIQSTDPLSVERPVRPPRTGELPGEFLLAGAERSGAHGTGTLSPESGALSLDPDPRWPEPLAVPVDVLGNVARASRGETVSSEVLGRGNGSIANQRFTLKNAPLTYLSAPSAGNDLGLVSTLRIWVGGIEFREVPTLFGAGRDDEVFTVELDAAGKATIVGGDGRRGCRLPSGALVVATYRFGAGAASPGPNDITQLASPVTGIASARSPLGAIGGADVEPASQVRKYAPRSALLLGRAVSMADMTVVAAGAPGVRAVQATWRWHQTRQSPVAYLTYVGDAGLEAAILQRVRSVTDPTTPIVVETAIPDEHELIVDVAINPRFVTDLVEPQVLATLTAPETGLLQPERQGIGAPLFDSAIFEAVLGVPGVEAVTGLQIDGTPFPQTAVETPTGHWLDFTDRVVVGAVAGSLT